MAGIFSPKPPTPIPVVNPADAANRQNMAMADRLQAGGTNADNTSGNAMAAVGGARMPTLTGLS